MSYTIKFVMQKEDLTVLKKALETYKPNKKAENITKDLLSLIKYQEKEKQNER